MRLDNLLDNKFKKLLIIYLSLKRKLKLAFRIPNYTMDYQMLKI